ncbi:GH92 family glycosyl hydrolase [Abyssalbus ytuae]|uniref:Glycoside hydrolase family 92 protein n=1 Tax=Abyssalbus ytuae TaxID=2926907 RepID=A0A9E6ZKX3_9FLAO|nr:GH92 family glycosyl hydrolase [Abyssalbus ytuae]UOB16115.1 glycoside hydrolase family 92 protein [Abyssalbus ytuae]
MPFLIQYKKLILCSLVLMVSVQLRCQIPPSTIAENAKYINPFICTANDHGQTDPSAGVPFGMAKPCADTYPLGHAGYNYNSNKILGFSNTRISGVGCDGAGGNIRIFPSVIGDTTLQSLKSDFFKETEVAKAGYYYVKLKNNIAVELSATRNTAFHQYNFPKTSKPILVIDLSSSFNGKAQEHHQIHDNGIISGWVSGKNVCNKGNYKFYFAIKTTREFYAAEEINSKICLKYKSQEDNSILLKCALSVVSRQHAVNNLKESDSYSFENVVKKAYSEWNKKANVIKVETENDTLKRIFYSHLFHALQTPFSVSEEDGSYKGSNARIYSNSGKRYFHGWSVWDTFRTKLPLFTLLYPEDLSEMMGSVKELYKQGKPQWASETEPFITVRTEHSVIALLDAYKKGLLNFSLEEIYPLLEKEISGLSFKTPDNVLELSYDIWALAQISKELNKADEYKYYLKKAHQYKNIWIEKFKYMDDRSDIMHGDGLYEGTLWQYRWFVPFDIDGLQALVGGKKDFEEQLDYFFKEELFNIGNQPDIQTPYLYNYTASPWKTQQLINKILTRETNNWYGTHHKLKTPVTKKVFTDTPEGYIAEMDDDAGTMASWFIWSSIGLYPICPGEPVLAITSPLFNRTVIKTKSEDLEIIAHNLTKKAIYIQKITLNGEPLENFFISFNKIKNGGKLELFMSEKPY